MLTRKITVDLHDCNACGDCTRACLKQLGERPDHANEHLARIKVLGQGPLYWLGVCRECAEAPCANACISGALEKNPALERVDFTESVCVGCAMCVMVCPFGSIWLDGLKSKSVKCDMCPTREIPPCVAACRTGALRVDASAALAAHHRRRATVAKLTPDRLGVSPITVPQLTRGVDR